jgi:NAD(P)-dependent dehydrogenase (short-subunit alcohol dehydrogenase family)
MPLLCGRSAPAPISISKSAKPHSPINVTAGARLSFTAPRSMLDAGLGRIVNVPSSISAQPAGMRRASAYATSQSALEAHTLNLAAEIAGTGGYRERVPTRRR